MPEVISLCIGKQLAAALSKIAAKTGLALKGGDAVSTEAVKSLGNCGFSQLQAQKILNHISNSIQRQISREVAKNTDNGCVALISNALRDATNNFMSALNMSPKQLDHALEIAIPKDVSHIETMDPHSSKIGGVLQQNGIDGAVATKLARYLSYGVIRYISQHSGNEAANLVAFNAMNAVDCLGKGLENLFSRKDLFSSPKQIDIAKFRGDIIKSNGGLGYSETVYLEGVGKISIGKKLIAEGKKSAGEAKIRDGERLIAKSKRLKEESVRRLHSLNNSVLDNDGFESFDKSKLQGINNLAKGEKLISSGEIAQGQKEIEEGQRLIINADKMRNALVISDAEALLEKWTKPQSMWSRFKDAITPKSQLEKDIERDVKRQEEWFNKKIGRYQQDLDKTKDLIASIQRQRIEKTTDGNNHTEKDHVASLSQGQYLVKDVHGILDSSGIMQKTITVDDSQKLSELNKAVTMKNWLKDSFPEFSAHWEAKVKQLATSIQGRNKVVLIYGGVNPESNHSHYYTDLKKSYGLLTQNLKISPENIQIFYADGKIPQADIHFFDGAKLEPAEKNKIQAYFDELKGSQKDTDHLFVKSFDHGTARNGTAYLCLWGNNMNGWLNEQEFGDMFKGLKGYKTIACEQCYAGGLKRNLDLKDGKTFFTSASSAIESSWSDGHSSALNDYLLFSVKSGEQPSTYRMAAKAYSDDPFTQPFISQKGISQEHPTVAGANFSIFAKSITPQTDGTYRWC